MTWLLALDTSTPFTALALGRLDGDPDAPLVACHDDRAAPASAQLTERIAALLDAAALRPDQLAAIACGRGPGTFTGCRVALATAKGLALALGRPLYGISSLAALAADEVDAGPVLALLDARRGDVYAAAFFAAGGRLVRVSDDRCCPIGQAIADLPDDLRDRVRPLGPGAAAYLDAMPPDLRARALPERALGPTGLWRAALDRVRGGPPDDLDALDVLYLRASYAELGLNTPKRPPYRSPFV